MHVGSFMSGAQYFPNRGGQTHIAGPVEKPSSKQVRFHLGLEDSTDIVVGGNY